jgi:hypothetical protein
MGIGTIAGKEGRVMKTRKTTLDDVLEAYVRSCKEAEKLRKQCRLLEHHVKTLEQGRQTLLDRLEKFEKKWAETGLGWEFLAKNKRR